MFSCHCIPGPLSVSFSVLLDFRTWGLYSQGLNIYPLKDLRCSDYTLYTNALRSDNSVEIYINFIYKGKITEIWHPQNAQLLSLLYLSWTTSWENCWLKDRSSRHLTIMPAWENLHWPDKHVNIKTLQANTLNTLK